MTIKDINEIIKVICPNDEDYEKPIISPKYLRQELEQLALEQEHRHLDQEPTTKNDLGVDCISRDVVKNYIQAHIHEIITESGEDKNKHTNRVLRSMIHGVNCMPSITPQEAKTGHWISRWYAGHDFRFHVCSECNEEFSCDMETGINIDNYRYCPNCGAKMAETEKT